jgi:hypothetical protein
VADIARERVAAGLPGEVRARAEQRGRARDLDGAKALAREELGAPAAGRPGRPAAARPT